MKEELRLIEQLKHDVESRIEAARKMKAKSTSVAAYYSGMLRGYEHIMEDLETLEQNKKEK